MKITRTTFIIIFAALSLWVIGNIRIIGEKEFEYAVSSGDYRYMINMSVMDKTGKEKNYSFYAKSTESSKKSSLFFGIISQGFFGPKYHNKIKITALEIESESSNNSQIYPIKTKAP